MNILITFITVVAWPIAIFSTLIVALKLLLEFSQTKLDKAIDATRGICHNYTKNLIAWFFAMIVSWAWIITMFVM